MSFRWKDKEMGAGAKPLENVWNSRLFNRREKPWYKEGSAKRALSFFRWKWQESRPLEPPSCVPKTGGRYPHSSDTSPLIKLFCSVLTLQYGPLLLFDVLISGWKGLLRILCASMMSPPIFPPRRGTVLHSKWFPLLNLQDVILQIFHGQSPSTLFFFTPASLCLVLATGNLNHLSIFPGTKPLHLILLYSCFIIPGIATGNLNPLSSLFSSTAPSVP